MAALGTQVAASPTALGATVAPIQNTAQVIPTATPQVVIATTAVPTNVPPVATSTLALPPASSSNTGAVNSGTYTLQTGEFPFCIARRYNVDPGEMLALSGLSDGVLYAPGTLLRIPQNGNPFPGSRVLHNHPDTYTVDLSNETIYGVEIGRAHV